MNKVLKERSDVLVQTILRMRYGDTITHSEIEEILGVSHKVHDYQAIIQRVRKLLQENECKYIENVWGIGYKLVEPDKVVGHSLKLVKSGCNRIQKGQKVLTYSPADEMSQEGRETYRKVCDRMAILNAAAQGAVVEMKLLSKPSAFELSARAHREGKQ